MTLLDLQNGTFIIGAVYNMHVICALTHFKMHEFENA